MFCELNWKAKLQLVTKNKNKLQVVQKRNNAPLWADGQSASAYVWN